MRSSGPLSLVLSALLSAACGGGSDSAVSSLTTTSASMPASATSSTSAPTTSSTTSSTTTSTIAPDEQTFARPIAINDSNEVLLQVMSPMQRTPVPGPSSSRTVILDTATGGQRTMPTPDPQSPAWAIGMNDAGVVVANVEVSNAGAACTGIPGPCSVLDAVVWSSKTGVVDRLTGAMADAGPNDAGLVVVTLNPDRLFAEDGNSQLAVWDTTTDRVSVLEVPGTPDALLPQGPMFINDRGQVAALVSGSLELAMWDASSGQLELVDTTAVGTTSNRLVGLDDTGRAIACDDGTFSGCSVWDPADGQWHRLVGADGTPPAGYGAGAVSGSGLVAGSTYADGAEGQRPTYRIEVWDLDAGWRSTKPIGLDGMQYAMPIDINDAGQIVVLMDVDDVQMSRPYLYEPTTGTWTELEL